MPAAPTLHFVYNVDGTPLALAMDFLHRLREPETYPCRLCDLTYGRFLKRGDWSAFVASLPVNARFHVRDAFRKRSPASADAPLPAVFVEPAGRRRSSPLEILISAAELNEVSELAHLQALVTERVRGLVP